METNQWHRRIADQRAADLMESSAGQRTSGPPYARGSERAGCVEAYQSVVASYAIPYHYVSPWQSSSPVYIDVRWNAGKKRRREEEEERQKDRHRLLSSVRSGEAALRNFFFLERTIVNVTRPHTPIHTIRARVRASLRGRRVIVCCVYPSFRGNRTICRRFVNAATFFVIPSPPPPMTMEFFSPLFYSLSLCLLIFHYPLYSPAQNRGKNRLLADSTRPRVEATANHRGIDH